MHLPVPLPLLRFFALAPTGAHLLWLSLILLLPLPRSDYGDHGEWTAASGPQRVDHGIWNHSKGNHSKGTPVE